MYLSDAFNIKIHAEAEQSNIQVYSVWYYNITLKFQTAKYTFDMLPLKTEGLVWNFIFNGSFKNLQVVRRVNIN